MHPLEVALACQRDERGAVEVRVGDRRGQVQGARAERAEAHAGAAGEAPVDVRHVRASLLVADGHELDRGVGERLVEVERLFARDAEDVPHALCLEAFDEEVRRFSRGHPRSSHGVPAGLYNSVSGGPGGYEEPPLQERDFAADCRLGAWPCTVDRKAGEGPLTCAG